VCYKFQLLSVFNPVSNQFFRYQDRLMENYPVFMAHNKKNTSLFVCESFSCLLARCVLLEFRETFLFACFSVAPCLFWSWVFGYFSGIFG
jgi:hypothetical protein